MLSTSYISVFEAGLQRLMTIPTVRFRYLGTPAETDRPVIDRSYSYKLVVGFDDRAGHDAHSWGSPNNPGCPRNDGFEGVE